MFFQGRKANGKLKFRGYDEIQYKMFLDRYKEGTWFNIKITKAQKPKTSEQLGYYYAVILPLIKQQLIRDGHSMTVCGITMPINERQTDKVIKYYCARRDEDDNMVLHDAENYPDRPIVDKRNMGLDHARQFIDNVINWAADYLGCQIPEAKRE